MKKLRNFFLATLFLTIALTGSGYWFVNSELGNDISFIKDSKTSMKNAVKDYYEDKKYELVSNTMHRFGYEVEKPGVAKIVKNEELNKELIKPTTEEKPQPKVEEKPADNKKQVSEFKPLVIPYFYDHSAAPSNMSKEEVLSLLKKTSDVWQEACNVSFEYKGDRLTDYVDVNNTIDRQEGLVKWGVLPGRAIGQAHQGTAQGPAIGFVLTLSPKFFASKENSSYLFPTMLHEMGHVLGLDHSKNPSSIMYFEQTDRGQKLNDTDKTMCKYFRARWQGMSAKEASDKYGILVNENVTQQEVNEEE